MRWLLFIAVSALLAISCEGATLQALLIRSSNDGTNSDVRLKDITPKLQKQFGYKFYRQLGTRQGTLKPETTPKMELGEGFALFATAKGAEKITPPKGPATTQHTLDLEWYSGNTRLVKSTVKISQNGYVFIKGPAVGNDWILLAVTVRDGR
jgi:hypothetical protein